MYQPQNNNFNSLLRSESRCHFVYTMAMVWTVVLVSCMSNPAFAQDENSQTAETDQPAALKSLSVQDLLLYLANEKVVAAGVGFINGQIGDPMSSILNIWGEPLRTRQMGVLLGSLEFFYQPEPNLAVVFTGRETVKIISIKGTPAALFRTARGARMGSTTNTVSALYSDQKVTVRRSRAEFREIGINFHFEQNRLDKVVVYSPDD